MKLRTLFTYSAVFAVTAFGLSGCAVMEPEECQYADWYQLGHQDALSGSNHIQSRAQICHKAGIQINAQAYEHGLQSGKVHFCTADSGYSMGSQGRYYKMGFCPPHAEAAFLSGYTPAYAKYEYEQKSEDIQRKIDQKNRDIAHEMKKPKPEKKQVDLLHHELRELHMQMRYHMMQRSHY